MLALFKALKEGRKLTYRGANGIRYEMIGCKTSVASSRLAFLKNRVAKVRLKSL